MKNVPRAISVQQLHELYGISPSSAYRMIKSGELKSVKIGGKRLFSIDVIEALIKSGAK